MTLVTGGLKLVTKNPMAVTEVLVRAPAPRVDGTDLVGDWSDREPVENGQVSLDLLPGPVVMTLVSGGSPMLVVKLLVPDKEAETLAECVRLAGLVDEGTQSTLTRLAEEVTAAADRVGTAEQVGVWASDAQAAASTAEGIASELPTTIATELDTRLPTELDNRVPPLVTDTLAQDSTIVTAAQDAVYAEVDAGLPGKADTAYVDAELAKKSNTGHKHGSGDISEKTIYAGDPADAFKMLYLNYEGKFRIHTDSITVGTDPLNKEYFERHGWRKDVVGTSITSLDDLADGVWSVAATTVAGNLGIPGRALGNLQLATISSGRTALYVTGDPAPTILLQSKSSDGAWSGWVPLGDGGASSGSWDRGVVPTDVSSMDDLADGMWAVSSSAASSALGTPTTYGNLQIQTIGNTRTAFYISSSGGFYITTGNGGVWEPWTQLGTGGSGVSQQYVDDELAKKSDVGHTHDKSEIAGLGLKPPSPASATSLKVVPLALTLGTGSTGGAPVDGHYRVPMRYTAPILRWRLAIGNANPYYITTGPADLTIGAITVGEHAGDGSFTAAPTTVAEGVHIPSGARTITYTEWQDTPLGDGRDMLLGFTYTSNNATAPPLLVGGSWKFDATTPATDVAPIGGVQSTGTPLDIWIEAETLGGTPVVAVVGDSTSCGVGATTPVYDSWLSVYCRDNKALPVHYANSGHTALDWNAYPEHYRINRWNHLPQPDAVIFALGNNDMGSDTPPMSERATESYRIIRERIGDNVYAATVKPRTNLTTVEQQRRQDYITWLMGPGKMLFRDAFDVNTPLGDTTLLPAYDSGDGAHLNTAGYEVYASAIGQVVTAPLAYQTV